MVEMGVLNPVADTKTEKFELASRLTDLNGKTIGLFWNAKSGGDVLLEQNAELLKQRYSGIKFRNYLGAEGFVMRHLTAEQAEVIARECHAVIGSTSD